jgi:hypothetical protein
MRIRIAIGGFYALLAVLPAGAQNNLGVRVIDPPRTLPQVTSSPLPEPILPFVYSAPLTPPGSPVQPFVESPVGPYGRLGTPTAPPAAPVVRAQPTAVVPNGIMLSIGAIVAPNTASSPAYPPANGLLAPDPQFVNSPFSMFLDPALAPAEDESSRTIREGRNFRNRTDDPPLESPLLNPSTSPLSPAPTPGADPTRTTPSLRTPLPTLSQFPVGTSLADVMEALGMPVVAVNEVNGQELFFNGGIRLFVRDGVVQEKN